jgi:hypothetical protein
MAANAARAGASQEDARAFFIWLRGPELLSRGEKLGRYARFG